ncbi:SDR family oxidoreductase [Streptomyces sp. NPDC012623]|uniref:SDR family oxidoreductase n=1 Tax=unclassified Streptomyces TaxID=2593676 RepID=UPI0036C8DD23
MSSPAALITGGTSGIGKATAELLHQRGYRVMVTGQNPDTLAAARKELPEDVVVLRADSRSASDTDRLTSEVRTRFGSLDALFLNAGISRAAPLEAVDEATYDDVFAINTKGQFFTLQRTLPLLRDGASVIFTVGIGAIRGVPGGSLTAASRGALLTMVPSLAIELAPRRIRVNAVSPGAIETPIWSKSGLSSEELSAVAENMAVHIPFGRMGSAREVAETVAFLASDASGYVTGQNIVVGGGSGIAA